jgi:hypothetical protein
MEVRDRAIKVNGQTQGWQGKVPGGLLALGLGASLFAGTAFSGTAEARITGPRLDSLTFQCGAMQDRADELKAEYSTIGRANPSDPRLESFSRSCVRSARTGARSASVPSAPSR